MSARGNDTIGVIGAGAAGLAVSRRLLAAGLPFETLERYDDVGGLWNIARPDSPVYASTRLISSKGMTGYRDHPMPADWPEYPSHEQALEYLRSYADRFGLREHIRFGCDVLSARRDENGWAVTTGDGPVRRYRALVLAHGFHSEPRLPELSGELGVEVVHSREYTTPDAFAGRRVLVIGGGNSGCDIAVDAADHAERALLSLRRGYWFIPKTILGRPADRIGEVGLKLRLPLAIRRAVSVAMLRLFCGDQTRFGLPAPDHRLLESHPIINTRIREVARTGRLTVKPDVAHVEGDVVVFTDGTRETVDLIVAATGYRIAFPFLEPDALPHRDGLPDLWLHMFPREHDDLVVCGMIQPDSGVWWLVDDQARLAAAYLGAADRGWFDALKAGPQPELGGGISYVASRRHHTEVEHSSYARLLRKLTARLL